MTRANFIWPGFSENLRVVEGSSSAASTKWAPGRPRSATSQRGGHQPGRGGCGPGDPGLLLSVDRDLWREEAKQIRAFYAQFGDKLPQTLEKELEGLEARLQD